MNDPDPSTETRDGAVSACWNADKTRSLTRMAMGISHDFNNLMAAVLGNAAMMLRLLPPDSPVRENAMEIQLTAQQAMDLVRQLTAYCGRADYREESVDLCSLMSALSEDIHRLARQNVSVRITLDPATPPVRGDRQQLAEMVMNLIQNAIDAMCDVQGTLTLHCHRVHVTADELRHAISERPLAEGDYVAVDVCDTGTGIDEPGMRDLFDPGFSTRIRGRGMGLSVVFGVLRAHKGAVIVESTPGHGSRFRLLLPPA